MEACNRKVNTQWIDGQLEAYNIGMMWYKRRSWTMMEEAWPNFWNKFSSILAVNWKKSRFSTQCYHEVLFKYLQYFDYKHIISILNLPLSTKIEALILDVMNLQVPKWNLSQII